MDGGKPGHILGIVLLIVSETGTDLGTALTREDRPALLAAFGHISWRGIIYTISSVVGRR